jgi:hypothetical protein
MKISKKLKAVLFGAAFAMYLFAYFATTSFETHGPDGGGLLGPTSTRTFCCEGHLVAFYPFYLIERWSRNGSFTHAGYYFNCRFSDGKYEHGWLYGDGKYSRIWYDAF